WAVVLAASTVALSSAAVMRYLTPLILVRPPIRFKPARVTVSVRVFRLARNARRPVWSPGYYALQILRHIQLSGD
ncbi:MAG TPA: hypothetical protein VED20_14835, partial [Streptosporangiaceae bacterium]|nr:hypothetical protein [Streptosporangiaceae bacterium]